MSFVFPNPMPDAKQFLAGRGLWIVGCLQEYRRANGLAILAPSLAAEQIERLIDEWDKAHKTRAKRAAFTIPTPEEVWAYSASIGYPLDGQEWCDFYARKGWKVGSTMMRDFKAAVRVWKAKGYRTGSDLAHSALHGAASLGSLQLQLGRTENEINELLYPGGCAFRVTLTGDKQKRFEELMAFRKSLKDRIGKF